MDVCDRGRCFLGDTLGFKAESLQRVQQTVLLQELLDQLRRVAHNSNYKCD